MYQRHLALWTNKAFSYSVVLYTLFFATSVILTSYVRSYIEVYSGYIVPDTILDNIPTMDVGFIFFQGAFIFALMVIAILIYTPRSIPFTLATSSLFFIVRAFFMGMTHLSAPFVAHYSYYEYEHHTREILFTLSSGNDMFFSGHAGFPCLLSFIFWKHKALRYFFILCSIIASSAVLLGHLHYSIDVFSSYFIAFGVFSAAKALFKKEYTIHEIELKEEIKKA